MRIMNIFAVVLQSKARLFIVGIVFFLFSCEKGRHGEEWFKIEKPIVLISGKSLRFIGLYKSEDSIRYVFNDKENTGLSSDDLAELFNYLPYLNGAFRFPNTESSKIENGDFLVNIELKICLVDDVEFNVSDEQTFDFIYLFDGFVRGEQVKGKLLD